MSKEVSTPVMVAIVLVFVALVGVLGWYLINKPVPAMPKNAQTQPMVVGGSAQGSGGPATPAEAKN